MTFSRFIVSAASIAAAVACAPAFAQQHEVGHWFGAPATSSAAVQATFSSGVLTVTGPASSSAAGVDVLVHPSFAGGVFVASGDVTGDARHFDGFVSRFPAGGRADAVPATPLDDPGLQTRNARQEATGNKYNDIILKNTTVAAGRDRDMTLKGRNIPQNAREIQPVAGVGSGDSTTWVRTAQPHTTTSVVPPRVGWEVWEVQPGRALNAAPPAAGMRPGPKPGGQGASPRR